MLITKHIKPTKKTASYRLDAELLGEFRALCKEHDLVQTHILENAIKKAIGEIKQMEKKDDR